MVHGPRVEPECKNGKDCPICDAARPPTKATPEAILLALVLECGDFGRIPNERVTRMVWEADSESYGSVLEVVYKGLREMGYVPQSFDSGDWRKRA